MNSSLPLTFQENEPAKAFLLDHYEEGAGEVTTTDVYTSYKAWCDEMGFSPMNSSNFGREVKRVFKNVERRQKKENGQQFRIYAELVKK